MLEEKQVRIAQMIYVLIYKEHERPTEHKGKEQKKEIQPNSFRRSIREEIFLQRKWIN